MKFKTRSQQKECFLANRWWCWPIWKTNAPREGIAQLYATCVPVCVACFIVLLKSCDVSPTRLWPRHWNITSTLTNLDLAFNDIGPEPEGAKAWCLVGMGSWGERVWRDCRVFSKNSLRFWVSCLAFVSSAPSEMLALGKTIGCPGHKNSQMLATICWCVQNSSLRSKIPQTSASLKCRV